MPNVIDLINKTDYDAKISDIESKCCTASDCNKFKNNLLDEKIKSKKVLNESRTSKFINNYDLDKKMLPLAKKA